MPTPRIYFSPEHGQYIMSVRPPDHPGNGAVKPHRRRHPIPPDRYATPSQRALQQTLDLAARAVKRFHPSLQVGWLVYLLERLEALYEKDEFHHVQPILEALMQDIQGRLEHGIW